MKGLVESILDIDDNQLNKNTEVAEAYDWLKKYFCTNSYSSRENILKVEFNGKNFVIDKNVTDLRLTELGKQMIKSEGSLPKYPYKYKLKACPRMTYNIYDCKYDWLQVIELGPTNTIGVCGDTISSNLISQFPNHTLDLHSELTPIPDIAVLRKAKRIRFYSKTSARDFIHHLIGGNVDVVVN